MSTYISPTGNPEVWPEKPEGYLTQDEWMAQNPEPKPEPLPAATVAPGILLTVALKQVAETAPLTDREIATIGFAGYLDEWAAGVAYAAGKRLSHGGVAYEVMQAVVGQEHQPPGSDGLLAIYRPVDGAAGTADDPKTFFPGMDVFEGFHYLHDGSLWLAKADMTPCVWAPGTAGIWQWELVEGGAAPGVESAAFSVDPEGAEEAPVLYRLNAAGTLYHTLDCSYGGQAADQLTLAEVALMYPAANPCSRCAPPALTTEGDALE